MLGFMHLEKLTKNVLKIFSLFILNLGILNFSESINTSQFESDLLLFGLELKSTFITFTISFMISAFTLILLKFFSPFVEIYLNYYQKLTFYLLVTFISLSTIYMLFRIIGYYRLLIIIYVFLSSICLLIIDKIK